MAVQLKFVESISAIRESIGTFNAEASTALDLVMDLVRQTSYWVFDPGSEVFAPSKFVAFERLTLQDYEAARNGEGEGQPFDGHETRLKIQDVLGLAYGANEELEGKLISWARKTIPGTDDFLRNVDRSKWKFVSLPLESRAHNPWTPHEIAVIVEDYFAMLREELANREYNKKAHRRKLVGLLSNRSEAAIEFKHCNISAVLDSLGLVYISGYKPRWNYQQELADVVIQYVDKYEEDVTRIEPDAAASAVFQIPNDTENLSDIFEEPPNIADTVEPGARLVMPVKVDWAARDSQNRALGASGEEFVAALERQLLTLAGRPDLAVLVEIVSDTRGDGLGYDVRSFTVEGEHKFIEVKSTRAGKTRPFLLTANELEVSAQLTDRYWLYRLYRTQGNVRIYRLRGPLWQHLRLTPVLYNAKVLAP